MIAKNGVFRTICIAFVAVAFSMTISGGALAQENAVAPDEQTTSFPMKPASCQNTAQCCQPSQPHAGIISRVNRFLAFGCRLNYQIDNWILGDKCDMGK